MDRKTMATNNKFDAINYMGEQRQKLSKKLSKMSKEEIVAYFRQKRLENTIKPSA